MPTKPTFSQVTGGIEQSAVSTKEQAEKPADSAKPAKNVQKTSRGKQVPQTEGKAKALRGMRKEKKKAIWRALSFVHILWARSTKCAQNSRLFR
ncbi:hypothetical protein JTB14_034380 [Gonioctena quinquepunctata]|nr:hypothetical protein JTB14_034380 [Gonioctena quinquepunctata]